MKTVIVKTIEKELLKLESCDEVRVITPSSTLKINKNENLTYAFEDARLILYSNSSTKKSDGREFDAISKLISIYSTTECTIIIIDPNFEDVIDIDKFDIEIIDNEIKEISKSIKEIKVKSSYGLIGNERIQYEASIDKLMSLKLKKVKI